MDFELVAEGLAFPEGPVAMDDGSVILTEIVSGKLTRVTKDGKKQTVAQTGGGPNGLALGPDGALYVCNNGGSFTHRMIDGFMFSGPAPPTHQGGMIQRVEIGSGKCETVFEWAGEDRLLAPNDIVFDRGGGYWFTDHGRSDGKRLDYGGVCYVPPGGDKAIKVRRHMISPNGIGLSPDETAVYVADSHLCRLWSFALSEPGKLGPQPKFQPGAVVANLPGYEPLDSLAVEADGRVSVATIINGGITTFAVDGTSEHVALPDPLVTNLAFGGSDMRDVWVTCSGTGRLFKGRWPRPGLRLNFSA